LAARTALDRRSDSVTESTALACDLIGANVGAPTVVAVVCLSPDKNWRDAGTRILEMLESLGAEVSQVEDESTARPIVLRMFGFCDLPLADFHGPYLQALNERLDRMDACLKELQQQGDVQ
jgi:hypothetical protein